MWKIAAAVVGTKPINSSAKALTTVGGISKLFCWHVVVVRILKAIFDKAFPDMPGRMPTRPSLGRYG